MQKLKLNVEELAIESFEASAAQRGDDRAVEAFVPNTQQVKCTYFCNYPTGFC